MAFTVETGSQVVGANSFLSLVEYAAYLADTGRSDSDADAVKQGRIVRATQYLVAKYRWIGTRLGGDDEQGLPWPRDGAYDEMGNEINGLPLALKHATAEVAYAFKTADLSPAPSTDAGFVSRKREKVGPLEEETEYTGGYSSASLKRFPLVDGLLQGLTVSTDVLLRT